MCARIRMGTHLRVHVYLHPCVCVCAYGCVCAYACTLTQDPIPSQTHELLSISANTRHTQVRLACSTHTYMFVHTDTYAHKPARSNRPAKPRGGMLHGSDAIASTPLIYWRCLCRSFITINKCRQCSHTPGSPRRERRTRRGSAMPVALRATVTAVSYRLLFLVIMTMLMMMMMMMTQCPWCRLSRLDRG